MNVLLTGATGYIGQRVAAKLRGHGHSVSGFVRSEAQRVELEHQGLNAVVGTLEEPTTLVDAAKRADAVIHTAFNHAGDFFESVRVEQNALDALLTALDGSGKTLIATSAAGVLGDTGDAPADEDMPLPDEEAWAVAKRGRLEANLKAATDLRTVVLRLPVLVYGRGSSQFPPMLIQTAKETGTAYYVGEGTNKISAAHVDDIAELYMLALEKAPSGSLYNVAAGDPVQPKALAGAVKDAAAVGGTASLSQAEAGEVWNPFLALLLSLNFWMSSEKAKRELGWMPECPSLLDDLRIGSYRSSDNA